MITGKRRVVGNMGKKTENLLIALFFTALFLGALVGGALKHMDKI